jgi:hypothetical protein
VHSRVDSSAGGTRSDGAPKLQARCITIYCTEHTRLGGPTVTSPRHGLHSPRNSTLRKAAQVVHAACEHSPVPLPQEDYWLPTQSTPFLESPCLPFTNKTSLALGLQNSYNRPDTFQIARRVRLDFSSLTTRYLTPHCPAATRRRASYLHLDNPIINRNTFLVHSPLGERQISHH